MIHLKRQPLDIPWTLYGLLQDIPLLRILRWPFRVIFVFLFPYAILIGYGLNYRLTSLKLDRTQKVLLTLSVAALLYGSSVFPIPIRPVGRSPHVTALDALADGAIIDVPFGRQSSRYFMSLQRTHRRPIIEGFISRNPLHAYDYFDSNALLAIMRDSAVPATLPKLEDWEAELDRLAADGFRYIVLHREVPVRQDHIPKLPTWIWDMFSPAVPAYQDNDVRIYDITALYQPESPIYGVNEFGFVHIEKHEPIQVGNTFVLHAWLPLGPVDVPACQSISIESWWKLAQRDPEPYSLTLILANPTGTAQITKADAVPANKFTTEWHPDRYYRDRSELQIPCDIEPGQYPLFMAMKESNSGSPLDFRYQNGDAIGTLYYLTSLNIAID